MFQWIRDSVSTVCSHVVAALKYVADGITKLCQRVGEAVSNICCGAASVTDWIVTGASLVVGGLLFAAAAALTAMSSVVMAVAAWTGSILLDAYLYVALVFTVGGMTLCGVLTSIAKGSIGAGCDAALAYLSSCYRMLRDFFTSALGIVSSIYWGVTMLLSGCSILEVLLLPIAAAWVFILMFRALVYMFSNMRLV